MLINAELKSARISPKKVKPLLSDLRKRSVSEVLDSLRYSNSKAGKMIYKLVASAVANAMNNYNVKIDNLKIKLLTADDGARYKRYWFRSHGAADVRLKRTAHLRVVLEEIIPIKVETVKKSIKASISTPKNSTPTSVSNVTPSLSADNIKLAKADVGKLKTKSIGKKIFTRTTNK